MADFKSLVVKVTKYYYSRDVKHCTSITGSTVVESRKRGTGKYNVLHSQGLSSAQMGLGTLAL